MSSDLTTEELEEWNDEASDLVKELTHPSLGLMRCPEAKLSKRIVDLISELRASWEREKIFKSGLELYATESGDNYTNDADEALREANKIRAGRDE